MDEIQKMLVKEGRKDLAQKYYKMISKKEGKYDLSVLRDAILDSFLSGVESEKKINKNLKAWGFDDFIIKANSIRIRGHNGFLTVKITDGKEIDFQIIVKMQPL